MLDFKFGDNWASEFGIVFKSINRPLLPAMTNRSLSLYQKDGMYDFGNNKYENRIITIECTFKGDNVSDMRLNARDIAGWLSFIDVNEKTKLIISDELDKFYYARLYNQVDLESILNYGKFTIEFECQPWAFSTLRTSESELLWVTDSPWTVSLPWSGADQYLITNITSTTNAVFSNTGTKKIDYTSSQDAYSKIEFFGSATSITLTLNNKSITITGISGSTVIIDNVNMTITKNGVNALSSSSGSLDYFLPINAGNNILNISGTGLNISTLSIDFRPEYR